MNVETPLNNEQNDRNAVKQTHGMELYQARERTDSQCVTALPVCDVQWPHPDAETNGNFVAAASIFWLFEGTILPAWIQFWLPNADKW